MNSPLPLVSIVTPFYNTVDYLEECIESVLKQDYPNFEYILVDNQSTDGSSEIAQRYARDHSGIRLFRTDHLLTQVQNYNFALSHISVSSKYCKICQADDWLYPRCVSEMVALAEQHDTATIISSYSIQGSEVVSTGLPPEVSLLSGRDACRKYFLDGLFLIGSPTSVLYRSSIVRQRGEKFYEEGRLHEDTELAFEVLRESDFGFVHQVLTYLREHEDSITGSREDLLPKDLDRMIVTARYGPHFLDGDEYSELIKTTRQHYHRRLAERWLRGLLRPGHTGFWRYHREGLATIGERVRYRLLIRGVFAAILGVLLCPATAMQGIRRVRKNRTDQPAATPILKA